MTRTTPPAPKRPDEDRRWVVPLVLPNPRLKKKRLDQLAQLGVAPDGARGGSLWVEAWRRLRRNPSAIVGAAILGLFILIAIIGPLIAPYDPTATIGVGNNEIRPGVIPGPSAEHWLGYDNLGRDEYSRMLAGARQTLLVGVVATLIGVTMGSLLGGVAGAAYGLGGRWGRRVDNVLMRVVDVLLSLPGLLLAITVAAVLGPSLTTVMISVGAVAVPVFARLLRGAMIAHSGSEYVLAATALGVRKRRIALAHILPNSLAPVLVQMTLTLATAIIEAAALSFLGLGNPDIATAEWGKMLADAQRHLEIYPGLAIYPALGIIITAFGFTLLGEAMREALDPKLRS